MKTLLLGWMAWGGLADLEITIRILNAGIIPDNIRRPGERRAAQILGSAGVTVRWAECPCTGEPGRNEFWVHVLDRPPRRLREAAGFAVIFPAGDARDGYAGIFYRNVTETAEREDADLAAMLGATIAHEIGHLLLGSNSHSPTGVMRLRLRRAELALASRGELRFTPENIARIRAMWERRGMGQ